MTALLAILAALVVAVLALGLISGEIDARVYRLVVTAVEVVGVLTLVVVAGWLHVPAPHWLRGVWR